MRWSVRCIIAGPTGKVDAIDPDDWDQEYLESLAKVTTPFRVLGDATHRPGLMLETRYDKPPTR